MLVPKLRFKEFTGEWKCLNFKEVATLFRGSSPRPIVNFIDRNNAGINWIKIGDVSETSKVITKTKENITIEGSKKSRKVFIDDIILSNSMSFGRPYILKIDGCIHDGWFVIRNYDNKLIRNYFYYYLSSPIIQKQYKTLSAGGVVSNISSDLVYSTYILFPIKKEQEKIADMLSLLDKKIELQTKKIEALKLYNKSTKTKLFQDLKDYEYQTLNDICIFENGKGHEMNIDNNGKYIVINSKFISSNGNIFKKSNIQLVPLFKDDIVMVMSDLPNGKALAKSYYISENNKYTLNQRICKLKSKTTKVNNLYLYYVINRNNYYLKFDDGINQTNLKKENILNLEIIVPSIQSQTILCNILQRIDKKIINEENKLCKLKNLKKGLMQNMFV